MSALAAKSEFASELRDLWKPGRTWRDGEDLPAMIDLPLGIFRMGEQEDDKFANDSERPTHQVDIAHPIAMGQYAVTAAEYARFTREPLRGEGRLPTAGVSWMDAQGYCAWLSARTGHHYRLPSEAEWEYASTGGTARAFPHGDEITPTDANYYYDEAGHRVGLGRLMPVGSYPPNPFGLYDMAGNVCEWVSDPWHANFAGAPEDGDSWQTVDVVDLRVLRGGAWDYLPRLLRCRWRDGLHQSVRRDNVGFRVVCAMLD